MSSYPADFIWGTSTSAHQVEGRNIHNDWWDFEVRFTSSGDACDFANRFEHDLDLARELGTNAFRFSLEWSRVEPRPGERDPAAIAYYERLVLACRERGLRPLMTLVHFTLPRWCSEKGGWLDPGTHEAFDRHVEWVAERFGESVDLFVTVNEPNVLSGAGYVAGLFPPGRKFRPDLADRCQAALIRAHARAYRILHATIERRNPRANVQVGVSPHVVSWKPSWLDPLGFVRRAGDLFNWGFLDALETGEIILDTLRETAPVRGTADFLGINYFMGMPAHLLGVLKFAGILRRPAKPGTSDMGWPIDAQGFETVLLEAHRRYRKPMIVTENGIACADDSKRPSYLLSHLASLDDARSKGADVRGYFHWSLIDNFEWHEGYGPRFGLYAVDYATQKRTARPSADVYRKSIAARSPARSEVAALGTA